MTYSVDVNSGIFETEAAALEGAVRRIADAVRPHAIYLFGSRAKGTHRPDSDFDFIVLTRKEDGEEGRNYARMRRALRGLGLDTDIVPIRIDDFAAEMESQVSMVSDAMRDALKVYDETDGFLLREVSPLQNRRIILGF